MKTFQNLTQRGRARRLRQLAFNALKCYDLDIARVSLVTNAMNGIFRVETRSGDKWILRVTLPQGGHNHDHVIAEMDWLSSLSPLSCSNHVLITCSPPFSAVSTSRRRAGLKLPLID